MPVPQYLSNKIRFFSIFLCILVVIAHAYKEELIVDLYADETLFFRIARFLSVGIGRLTVPLFFMISGYLFFKDFDSFSFKIYRAKIKKRILSILLPYLVISAIALLVSYLIDQYELSYIFKYEENTEEYTIRYILKSWLYRPEGYHLWFIRNLFLLGLFSPFIYYLVYSKWGVTFISIVGGLWILFSNVLPSMTGSILFFSLGGLIRLHKINIPKCKNILVPISIGICWLITTIRAVAYEWDTHIATTYLWDNISITLGVVLVWTIFDLIEGSSIQKISSSKLAGFVFFIYLVHEPFISYFINSSYYFFPSKTSLAIIYLLAPPITIAFCYLVGTLLKNYAHPIFHFISGGRQ